MPSPVGHALGGLAAAFLADSVARPASLTPRLLLACAGAAVAPDLDLFVRNHRTYTHSIGAIVIVALVAWLILRLRRARTAAPVAALTAAYASHLVLDWISKDSATPSGLTILWPLSSRFFISGFDLFGEVSRRYWLPEQFVLGNLRTAAWEVFVLMPVVVIAWMVWSGRSVQREKGKRKNENRKTKIE